MAAAAEVVLYAEEGGVACVPLNRPGRGNASNGDQSRALTAALARAGADPAVRVLLLMGGGRAFRDGADQQVRDDLTNDPYAPNSGPGGPRYAEWMQQGRGNSLDHSSQSL